MSNSRDIADSAATINFIDTVTSNVQTQLNTATAAIATNTSAISNISVTNGSLTKTFVNGETASISLTSSVLAPVVSVTKEVPQSGVTNNSWDVNSTSQNYTRLDSAAATTLNWVGGDISEATFASQSFNALSVVGGNVADLALKPDGLKMFLCAGTGVIYEYALSTAFDVSSASYSSTSSNISTQTPALTGISFSPNGAKMYAVGTTNRTIYEFDLSTPWSVASGSLSYSGNSFSIASKETSPTGVTLNPSGTKVYIIGYNSDSVHEFALSTAFDISSASFTSTFSIASQETSPQAILFNSDGTLMFICGSNSSKIHAYNLSSAYDISSSVYNSKFLSVASQTTSPVGFAFNPLGSKLMVFSANNSNVYGYTLPLALSLGSGSFASADVGKTIEANSGAFVLTATSGSYLQVTAPTSFNQVASGSWGMFGVIYNTTDGDLELSGGVGEGYSLSDASYTQTFSVSADDTSPAGIAFNTDGSKMYVVGGAGQDVNEYNLSTAFDISTSVISYAFSVGSQDTQPLDIHFSPSGSLMYILGTTSDSVYEYALSTAFYVGSASFVRSFYLGSQEIYLNGLTMSSDGTKMFVCGSQGADINEYTLSTAFNVSTASFVDSFSVSSQDSDPRGLSFNSDGTEIFMVGQSSQAIYKYSLATAYDISTASLADSFSIAAQETAPTGIAFSTGGAQMFVSGTTGDDVNEYSIQSITLLAGYHAAHTTASTDTTYWTDINSMTANQAAGSGNVYYCISTDDRTTWTVIDNTDGERDIVRNNAGTWQYNSNATYASETWANGTTNTELATIAQAMTGASSAVGYQLATASYDSVSFNASAQETNIFGLTFNADGTAMYTLGYGANTVYQYTLSTAYDITTASYASKSFSVASQETTALKVKFNTNGTKMFVVGQTNDTVFQYTLSTGFDVSTASYASVSFSVAAQEVNPVGMAFNTDGTKMFIVGSANNTVFQYTLSTGFDVSTASYASISFSVSNQSTSSNEVLFNSDGTKMFVLDNANPDEIYQYTLSTGFNVSTASYDSVSFDVTAQTTTASGMAFNGDGTKLLLASFNNGTIYQYNTSTVTYTNQMDKTQLDAVTDPNHIALGNDFDLSIILNMTSGTTVPSSNGVAINYDANILNQGAVLGTDYNFDAPAQNSVRITALAGNNLKVRVV